MMFAHQGVAKCDSLDMLNWINHSWRVESDTSITTESWRSVSDASFEGLGQTTDSQTGEVTFSESLRILQMADEIFFLAKVAENPYPVPFKLIACTDGSAVFSNPGHDFPQRLEYKLEEDKTLRVNVSAKNGRSFDVLYSRE
jgi:hypothetical protein